MTRFDRPDGAGIGSVDGIPPAAFKRVVLQAGRVRLLIALHPTATADLIWRALPLHSVAETWGDAIHFDTPVRTGRDRTARLNAQSGEVYFWAEDERVVVVWGPTPISRPDEIRLMRPCNLIGHTLEDASGLSIVTPGEKIALVKMRPERGS